MGTINTDLAGLIDTAKTKTLEVQNSEIPEASAPQTEVVTKAAPSKKKTAAKTASPKVQNSKTPNPEPDASVGEGSGGPKYMSLVPKEARLREDQIAALNDLARTLARNRSNKTERITSNTLIRIAIDRLLADAGNLTGDDENQLRTRYLNS